jgi:hypothetical protein
VDDLTAELMDQDVMLLEWLPGALLAGGVAVSNEPPRHAKRLTIRLTAKEMRDFRAVRKFVRAYCGEVSDAEVLRFLVRNWVLN